MQSINANTVPIIEFSEPTTETPLDLNSSQRGSQNLVYGAEQMESEGFSVTQQQQKVIPDITAATAGSDDASTPTGFESPSSKTRSGNVRPLSSLQKSRCHWTHGDIIALFDAKKTQTERSELVGSRKSRTSSSGKWEEIADLCKTLGVNKMASQCRDKWERLWPGFKKIFDWEKQIPEGKSNYWTMKEDEREREGFPRQFDKEIFDAMSARFGLATSLNLPMLMGGSVNEDSEAATGAFPDASTEPGQNGSSGLEDPPVTMADNHVPRSSGRKRKTPDRFGVAKCTPESNKKVTNFLEPKEEEGGNASTRLPKDGHPNNKSKMCLDFAERRMLLEERKFKLAEKRFSLEEKKLSATIEIGKGLIASMERMSATISNLGIISSQQ